MFFAIGVFPRLCIWVDTLQRHKKHDCVVADSQERHDDVGVAVLVSNLLDLGAANLL